jgi:hypothetical protein
MRKIGIKALAAILTIGLCSRTRIDWIFADHNIFDDCYSFPHRALCFSEMGKFVGAP